MSTRIFIVDDKLKAEVKKLIDFAEEHPFSMDDMLDVYNGNMPPCGQREGFYIDTEFGIRIVYSIEQQIPGDCRHLSVAVDKDHSYPNPVLVEEIMKLFGFNGGFKDCHVALEKYSETRGSVNIRQLK